MLNQILKLNGKVMAAMAVVAVVFGLVLIAPSVQAAAGWTAGKFSKTYDFNGQFYVDAGNVYNGVKTVAFWTRGTTYGGKVIDLDGTNYISISVSGVVSTTFSSPTIYIDGVVGTTIDSNWHYVAITTGTAINASTVKFGSVEVNNLIGMLDDVKMYNYALSSREINEKYRQGSPSMAQGGSINGDLTSTGNTTLATGASTTNTFGSGASSINTIGSATTPGALTLHGATALDNTFALTYSGSSTALTVTQSGTGNIVDLIGDSITTGTGLALTANGLTTGSGVNISSTSTAGGASGSSKMLDIARSGANANVSHTAYGLYSAITNTGTTSTNVGGYFSASGATNNYGLIVESGNVGIGTTAPSSILTISSTGDFAIGDYNAVLIDDMEAIADWTASDGTNTPVALESATVRKGSGAMKITTSATAANSLNDTIKKTFGANQNYSTYERIGFWIKATQTGQNISFAFNDTVAGASTYAVTIAEANQWQYEENNISGIAGTSRDVIDWVQFIINTYTDSSNPTFYIDQVRVYDSDERTSELFVDNDGNLIVWGRGGIELGRGVPGSSLAGLKIGSANIEINQPLNVNVAGDTGMAYDLQFLNTGGANITSQGALTISAGDPNKTQNLTLTTQANQMSGDSGVATATGGAATLTDSSKTWTLNEWAGGVIYIISGTGYGQERTVSSNTTNGIITVSSNWTTPPDTTSSYRLAYQQGGDVIVDVANSSNNYGGFKIAGSDNGGYVFRVSPDGNVEIGGNGSAGSNLVVKQNLSLTGGNITVSKLATPAGVAVVPVGTAGGVTYGYRISAVNNNGQTIASTTVTTTTGNAVLSATNYNQITWDAVSGATSYKVYGRTSGSELYMVTISAPNLIYNDTLAIVTPAGALPTANTTGGKIAVNTTSPARNLEVLDNSDPQMRLTYDASNRAEFQVNGTGVLTVTTAGTGTDVIVADDNFQVCAGGACPTVTFSGAGNLEVENKIYTNGDNENMPRHSCPTGWVLVPGSATFGTEDFCVMKYEAKQNSSTKNPESVAAGTPWVSISQYEAKNACTRIGAHLVNEAEWMTIARNTEAVAGNWTLGSVGSGYLFAGHNDNVPAAAKAASSTDTGDFRCAYTDIAGTTEAPTPCPTNTAAGTSGTAGNQVRVLTLSNGNVLWDIAGNVWEWTDAQCDATSWYSIYGPSEWNNANLTDYERIVGGSTAYTSANGVGQYYGCTANGNVFARGGDWPSGANGGVFELFLNNAPSTVGIWFGFRCAR